MKAISTSLLCSAICLAASLSPAFAQAPPGRDPAFSAFPISPESGDGRWKGALGFGMTINRGNTNSTQASLSADATRTLRDSRLILRALLIRATNESDTTADNDLGEARYERNFARTWFGFGGVTLERDPFRNLELRQSYALGSGYRVMRQEDFQLNVYGGIAYSLENRKTSDDARGWEPVVGNDLTYRLSENASITQRWALFPNTVGGGGIRSVFQMDINTKLSGRFGLQLSVLNKYRQYVQDQEKNSDTVIFTGITARF
jgi:putative salt-induced outer membrane protein YdiY